jgi:hypothetical protein
VKLQVVILPLALSYFPLLMAQVTVNPINGHYYEVIAASGITWEHANADANSMSYAGLPGHLVTIRDSEENTFISGLLNFPSLAYWAGGYQDPGNPLSLTDSTAGWKWVHNEGAIPTDNSAVGFAHWGIYSGGREPNDFGGAGSEQYLALIAYATAQKYPGGWGDYKNVTPSSVIWNDEAGDGGHEAGYVVEFEAVPEPSSTHWLMAGAAFCFCLLKKVSFKPRSRTILLQSKTSV